MKKNILITESQLEDLLKSLINMITGGGKFDLLSLLGGKKSSSSSSIKTDDEFYNKLLEELGAPKSDENLKFLQAWRQSEGKAGKYNSFNTTQPMADATNFNSVGVKNYESIDDGFKATIKTLKNGRYNCIVNGLKNDIGAKKISTDCISDLKTWGTGDLVAKVIKGYESGASPKISSLV
jgi:hypothetical protein